MAQGTNIFFFFLSPHSRTRTSPMGSDWVCERPVLERCHIWMLQAQGGERPWACLASKRYRELYAGEIRHLRPKGRTARRDCNRRRQSFYHRV